MRIYYFKIIFRKSNQIVHTMIFKELLKWTLAHKLRILLLMLNN